MFRQLREHNRLNETIFMGVITIVCFSFSMFRYFYTGDHFLLSLNWNLFLAFIPWAITSLAIVRPKLQSNKLIITVLLITWFLFFPNSPYIFTDLVHITQKSMMPLWFDLILILTFAWVGLLFGFLSLWDLESILEKRLNKTWISIISVCLLFLGSFGIYIGRDLRWNSWDVIREPFGLIYDIGAILIKPFHHPRAWGMTLTMFVFLNMVYWSFKIIKRNND